MSKLLQSIPNIGPAMAADLHLLGIREPADLKGRDPFQLYEELCKITGQQHDPCVADTFMAAVHYVDTGEARKWWAFTAERKRRFALASKKRE
ncbi:helix-hairpin-helix domain-containing protein [Chitinimonas sp. PSY-7]|uniref:helix-hairpin-helix domain-containing protein n=1 Tax=Chitinimonas sp. PSY-7 TaxID=3459088 RepID=UPI0040400BFB